MANHTILLIDYEPRSIERFRQPLTAAGYRVEIATDGIAGVEAFSRLNPDMVLVEAMIPKKHGFEVCQELKRTPHGRRTPIIITTGVYKGRKYRTQALHIYGCDEYIEKPIAAEQLLAIVDRFLSSAPASSREPVAAAVDASEASGSVAAQGPRIASDGSRPPTHKPNNGPKAVVADLTEDEIMARLDAILPVASPASADPVIEDAEPEAPVAVSPEIAVATEPAVETDPFLQMQAELTAELSGALALEPKPILEPVPDAIPSDQVAVPPLLESLPAEDAVIPLDPQEPTPTSAPTAPGQVVSFDAKRSRKNKKSGRKHGEATAAPAAERIEPARETAPAVERSPKSLKELGIPSGTLVESALGTEKPSRGIPAWAWIVVGVIALVIVYFMFWRGDVRTSRAVPEHAPAIAAARAPTPAISSVPPSSEPLPPAPAPTASPETNLVLNAVGPQPTHPAPAPALSPAATAPAAPPKPATKISDWKPSSAVSPRDPAPSVAPSALEVDHADAGVETIAAAAPEPPQRPTTAAGALVELAEVDTPPASLTRKLPVYSMQARQMKLQGTIVLKVLVNEQGAVEQVVVVSGIAGADLNDAAVKAARQWTYRPATKDGVPVKVWTTEQVTFKI